MLSTDSHRVGFGLFLASFAFDRPAVDPAGTAVLTVTLASESPIYTLGPVVCAPFDQVVAGVCRL